MKFSLPTLLLGIGSVVSFNLRKIVILNGEEIPIPPKSPDQDSINLAKSFQNSSYTNSIEGSILSFDPSGGEITFEYKNISLTVSLDSIQEFGMNETTGLVFPLVKIPGSGGNSSSGGDTTGSISPTIAPTSSSTSAATASATSSATTAATSTSTVSATSAATGGSTSAATGGATLTGTSTATSGNNRTRRLQNMVTAGDDMYTHQDNFTTTEFMYAAVDLQTIGDVNFQRVAVKATLNGVANFTLHIFQALNTGTATVWDKTYNFVPGMFKFSFELTNWNFCDSCMVPPTAEWDYGVLELPGSPGAVVKTTSSGNSTSGGSNTTTGSGNSITGGNNSTTGSGNSTTGGNNSTTGSGNSTTGVGNSTTGGSSSAMEVMPFYNYTLPAKYLDIRIRISSNTSDVLFAGDFDKTRNATIGQNYPNTTATATATTASRRYLQAIDGNSTITTNSTTGGGNTTTGGGNTTIGGGNTTTGGGNTTVGGGNSTTGGGNTTVGGGNSTTGGGNTTVGGNNSTTPVPISAVIAIASDYTLGNEHKLMPFGFPVTSYDDSKGSDGTGSYVTFRFERFETTDVLYYDPIVDLTGTGINATVGVNGTGGNSTGGGGGGNTTQPDPVGGGSSSKKKSCFAGSEAVTLSTGESKAISEVLVGEQILAATSEGQFIYDEVIAVPHGKNADAAEFTRIVTVSGRDIKMTADHLLLAGLCGDSSNMRLMQAQEVAVGNCVRTVDGDESVVSKSVMKGNGIYTLVTKRGDYIVVNGIVASPFSTNHAVANAFYNIHRAVYTLFPSLLQSSMLKQSGEIFHELLDNAVSA